MSSLTLLDPQPPQDAPQEVMQFLQDSTLAVAVPAVFGGYIMGCGFSLFGSMISVESATQAMGAKDYFKYTMRTAHRLGYNFAWFGVVFGGIEVALEKRRGVKDHWNPVITGGMLGGFYGWKSYRRPGLLGGVVGGAAASLAIEKLMDSLGMGQ